MRAGDAELGPRARASSCSTTSRSTTTSGRSSRSRSGSRSSWCASAARASSRCIRARRAPPRASCTSAAWDELVAANPVIGELEAEVEALIVNRMSEPHRYAVVPIDRCYELVGMIKSRWEGISGGSAIDDAVAEFFAGLDRAARAVSSAREAGGLPAGGMAGRRSSPSSPCSASRSSRTPSRPRCASGSASPSRRSARSSRSR